MSTTANCSFNLLPSSNSNLLVLNASLPQLSLRVKQCVGTKAAIACTVIALQMGHLGIAPQAEAVSHSTVSSQHEAKVISISQSENKVTKWSEQRACPAWRQNSFETVVPENLPRPAARRRYQSARSSAFHNASPIQNTNPRCFSM